MAVTSVLEDGTALEASAGIEEADAIRRFTVTFDTDDDPFKRPFLAMEANGIPHLREVHPHKNWLFVRNRRPKYIGPTYYEVEVFYTTSPQRGSDEQSDPFTSPLDQPWEYEWTFAEYTLPIDRDIEGKPILNPAKERYDPPPMKEISDQVLRISRYESSYNQVQAGNYKDSLNIDEFYGFPPGFVRCKNYSTRLVVVANLICFRVNYEFQMRKIGWKLKLFAEGRRFWNPVHSKYEPIVHIDGIGIGEPGYYEADKKDGTPVAEPWPLDLSGYVVSETEVNDGIAYFIERDIYPSLPFTNLGL